jgi:hypothetical protein
MVLCWGTSQIEAVGFWLLKLKQQFFYTLHQSKLAKDLQGDCIVYVGLNIMLSGRFLLLWVVETKHHTFRQAFVYKEIVLWVVEVIGLNGTIVQMQGSSLYNCDGSDSVYI